MLDQLDELYREVILEHFKHSAHSGELPGAQIHVSGANPLCGDELAFHVRIDGGRVARARFVAKGCAISQAASSMLAGALEGKTIPEIQQVIETMKALMQGKAPDPSVDLGDLEALSGVRKFPVRVKCAALSWNVVEQGLEQYQISPRKGDI
ncbi:MAG: SUF system NifU family Fe-S cluster assembly protein [Candidatus Omnitrophica bacterium]|nr:SUF system NifU family Fe-S cluster assembly protein [Candidatus Omnitrophota bacterium]